MQPDMTLDSKIERLRSILSDLPGALVAYSGGADSAFLAEVSHQVLGPKSIAVTADSPSLPRRELSLAVELAKSRGWNHRVVETLELNNENYASNPHDRCYFCKSALFERVSPMAHELGFSMLLGTNLDDLGDWRPGQKAAAEEGVRHPLVEAELSKDEVREASRQVGLPTSDKPASACLASRIAYGVRVTQDSLMRIEAAETYLFDRGFAVVRVRDLGDDHARVEVGSDEVARLLDNSSQVVAHLKSLGFRDVLIDERGYRQGALNEGIELDLLQVGKRS
jgi:uncharacterized protein